MTSSLYRIETDPLVYDFSTSINQFYGAGAVALDLGAGVYGTYSGEISYDGLIDVMDQTDISNNDGLTGYRIEDLNLNGVVEGSTSEADDLLLSSGLTDFAFSGVP